MVARFEAHGDTALPVNGGEALAGRQRGPLGKETRDVGQRPVVPPSAPGYSSSDGWGFDVRWVQATARPDCAHSCGWAVVQLYARVLHAVNPDS